MHEVGPIFVEWLLHYGGIALFIMLLLGIVGLPIPDETLLILAGWFIARGKLSLISILIFALLGSMCGISLSYWLGRTTGYFLAKKYGYWVGISHYKIVETRKWFTRQGKWTLVFGYFIPLIRHLTGYVAGATHLSYRSFALFAYSGACLWVIIFLSVGYFFGSEIVKSLFHRQ